MTRRPLDPERLEAWHLAYDHIADDTGSNAPEAVAYADRVLAAERPGNMTDERLAAIVEAFKAPLRTRGATAVVPIITPREETNR